MLIRAGIANRVSETLSKERIGHTRRSDRHFLENIISWIFGPAAIIKAAASIALAIKTKM